MKEQVAQFEHKYNVRPYTMVLLVLLAVSNNVLAAANLLQF